MKKINLGASMNVKNVNVQETFICQTGSCDEITINTPHSTLHYANKYPERFIDIDIIDINYDIDKFSIGQKKFFKNLRVCGKFTYKFRNLNADFRDILDTETIHTGYIYYFGKQYEDIKALKNYSYLYFRAEHDIVVKNDAYTRTVKIYAESKLSELVK